MKVIGAFTYQQRAAKTYMRNRRALTFPCEIKYVRHVSVRALAHSRIKRIRMRTRGLLRCAAAALRRKRCRAYGASCVYSDIRYAECEEDPRVHENCHRERVYRDMRTRALFQGAVVYTPACQTRFVPGYYLPRTKSNSTREHFSRQTYFVYPASQSNEKEAATECSLIFIPFYIIARAH